MAVSTRALRNASGVLLRDCAPRTRPALRPFSTYRPTLIARQHLLTSKTPTWQTTRKFTRATARYAAVQEPPRAESYLESGVVEQGKNLVDVKKVLVIGSGGLSIGQAGEFDYSGESNSTPHKPELSLILHLRCPSFESTQRGRRGIGFSESQHCDYSD